MFFATSRFNLLEKKKLIFYSMFFSPDSSFYSAIFLRNFTPSSPNVECKIPLSFLKRYTREKLKNTYPFYILQFIPKDFRKNSSRCKYFTFQANIRWIIRVLPSGTRDKRRLKGEMTKRTVRNIHVYNHDTIQYALRNEAHFSLSLSLFLYLYIVAHITESPVLHCQRAN